MRTRGVMKQEAKATGRWARLRARIADSAWAPIAGKIAGYGVGFLLLALVGSGRFASWLTPASKGLISIPAASAATLPIASIGSAAASAEAPAKVESGSDAGVETADAGASATEDAGAPGIDAAGKVLLNSASEDQIRRLPGVGPKKAKAIIELRTRMKRFQRVEDLLRVKGMGKRSLARLRPLVKID